MGLWGYEDSLRDDDPNDDVDDVCLCSKCGVMLRKGEDLVQNPVYKLGELQYIELAHRDCMPEWAVNDDWPDKPED